MKHTRRCSSCFLRVPSGMDGPVGKRKWLRVVAPSAPFRAPQVAGSTLHVVDEGIDTGKIIEIEPMEVDYSRSFFWNQIILYQRGIDAFIRMLGRLDDGSTVSDLATKQDANAEHNYFTLPTEDEISSFEKKGLKMYDVRELMEIAEQFHAFDIVREDAALPF